MCMAAGSVAYRLWDGARGVGGRPRRTTPRVPPGSLRRHPGSPSFPSAHRPHGDTAQLIAGVAGGPEARNPNVVEAPAPRAPFHDSLLTAAVDAPLTSVPFHA